MGRFVRFAGKLRRYITLRYVTLRARHRCEYQRAARTGGREDAIEIARGKLQISFVMKSIKKKKRERARGGEGGGEGSAMKNFVCEFRARARSICLAVNPR